MAMVQRRQSLAVAAAITAAALALPVAAQAQFLGGWGYQQPYYRSAPPSGGGFFSFPFFSRPRGYGPPAESYHAPSPRKLETQPSSTVVVIGDSMADWLAYGLEEIYADNGQIGVVRNVRLNSGLIHYEPRNDTLQWPQAVKDVLATEKPNAIVIMLGLNDRVPLRERTLPPTRDGKPAAPPAVTPAKQGQENKQDAKSATEAPPDAPPKSDEQPAEAADARHAVPGATYDFRTDEWAELYKKRIDEMIAAAKSKGVPVLWVGLPAVRGPRATSDMSYLDDLYHAEADKAGIAYVDIWDGFVDENGRYAVEGPDFEGQIRRLRTGDGVHFSKYGALKLAHLVDQQLSRVMANPAAATTVAPPAQQASAPAKPGAARPTIGPVLPLTAAGGAGGEVLGGGDSGNLMGGDTRVAPLASQDPTARNVLVRGDSVPAPAGRADNFTWPPSGDAGSAAATPPGAPAAH
jgi:uncharacterized protein